jgi:NAD(P)-dependent dehydrogenase (short-subunit alcohol dehydrogenase family)
MPDPLLALLYSVFRLFLDALVDRRHSDASLSLELLVLRHKLRVLKGQVKRPRWRSADRLTLGGQGGPKTFAYAVRYLASHAASFVTGEVLHVNGGQLFRR